MRVVRLVLLDAKNSVTLAARKGEIPDLVLLVHDLSQDHEDPWEVFTAVYNVLTCCIDQWGHWDTLEAWNDKVGRSADDLVDILDEGLIKIAPKIQRLKVVEEL